MTDVSFQGKSNLFISKDLYNNFVQRSENSKRVLKANRTTSISVGVHKPFLATPDCDDLLVVVRNEREGFMKKFPVLAQIEKIADDLYTKIEELQANTTEKLTAWIIGGNNYKQDNGKTIKAVNEIGEILCDRPDIDTSILVGPKKNNTISIGIQGNVGETNIILPNSKNSAITSTEDLQDLFDIVELNNVETKID